ncbi:hypothetical protein [Geoanaerobacter pelophilus]|uniref:hypothetical protein n=1 Tax=Geoanaerobacter pelophilus TaxID=60036 RepID=UPI00117AF9CC|nr:hypothetical protein [Geoanaerobacter pelophilus]
MSGRSPPPALTAPRGYSAAIPPRNTYNRSRHLNIEARGRQPGVVVKQLGDVVKHEANVVKHKGDVVKHGADVVKHKGDVNNQRHDFVNQGRFFFHKPGLFRIILLFCAHQAATLARVFI